MPVYNSELYINEAIDSILNQTFTDFEFIIIDDASTDKSVEIIQSYSDSRIQLIVKPQNSGYTNSLNYGLTIARGEYIARMDSDDISLPTRFQKQVEFLDANPDVVVCGTQYKVIGREKISNHPIYHEEIKVKLLDGCFIAHPSVMLNNAFLIKNKLNYNTSAEPAEDYDLWSRIVFLAKVANLNETLLLYRVSDNQVSIKRAFEQKQSALNVKLIMLQKLNPSLTADYFDSKTTIITVKTFLKNYNISKNLIFENKNSRLFQDQLFMDWISSENKKLIFNFYYEGVYNLTTHLFLLVKAPFFYKEIGFFRSIKMIFKIRNNTSK